MNQTETFGQRVARLRSGARLSQYALGEKAGISSQAVHLIETGKQKGVHDDTLQRLAAALSVSPAYLKYGADLRTPDDEHPPIEVYLRQTRPGLSEQDIAQVARIIDALYAQQLREMAERGEERAE